MNARSTSNAQSRDSETSRGTGGLARSNSSLGSASGSASSQNLYRQASLSYPRGPSVETTGPSPARGSEDTMGSRKTVRFTNLTKKKPKKSS